MTQRISAAITVLMILFSTSIVAFAERLGQEGNGGDAIEAFFLEKGSNLLARLSRTPEGQRYLRSLPVTLTELSDTLDYSKIFVYNGLLLDSTFAIVDAKVIDGNIYLSREAWLVHIQAHNNVNTLVLHEMLRAAGVVDNDYKYSRNVSMFSDLLDPREAMTLSQYIIPNEIEMNLNKYDQFLPIETFTYVNNIEMKLQISVQSQFDRNLLYGPSEKTFNLSIPVYSTGHTKIIIYRIDYEYFGLLNKDAKLKSDRSVRFQSSSEPVVQKGEDGGKKGANKVTVIDLMSLESTYKESLQIQVKNKIQAHKRDSASYLVLKRVVVYFNILRL